MAKVVPSTFWHAVSAGSRGPQDRLQMSFRSWGTPLRKGWEESGQRQQVRLKKSSFLFAQAISFWLRSSNEDPLYELSAYYESDLWMEDYEADEAGELPADLKRGVLSEDCLYNLLAEYEELLEGLRSLGNGA